MSRSANPRAALQAPRAQKAMRARLAQGLALASTGLLAGAFAYVTAIVVPTFYAVPTNVHLAFRQAWLDSNFAAVPPVMAFALLATIWFAVTLRDAPRAHACAAGASVLLLVSLLSRYLGPRINIQIRSWSPASPPVDYLQTLHRSEVFHDIRAAAVIGAFLLVLLAVDQAGRGKAAGPTRADDRPEMPKLSA
jgi:Domain of unknown function (DUF1772)